MSYGIRVWSEKGVVSYDTEFVTWNQFSTHEVPAYGVDSTALPDTKNKEYISLTFITESIPIDRKAVAPTVSFDGGSMVVSGASVSTVTVGLAR